MIWWIIAGVIVFVGVPAFCCAISLIVVGKNGDISDGTRDSERYQRQSNRKRC